MSTSRLNMLRQQLQDDNKRGSKKNLRKPTWLKAKAPEGERYESLRSTVRSLNLATVCEEAKCPNIGECWGGANGTSTATIMIMGEQCTRGCSFCNVKTSRRPKPLDPEEPANVSRAILDWGLDYVVLTSVDRDDLPDQGCNHFAETVRLLKMTNPAILVECLTPDFRGCKEFVSIVSNSGVDVYAHNVETVARLQRRVRDYRAGYKQSLGVLEHAKNSSAQSIITKSSLMLGLGETDAEVETTLMDLHNAGVDVVTLGQYLRPSKRHMSVQRYVSPEDFEYWKKKALDIGFKYCASGPLVRSSYRAGELYLTGMINENKKASNNTHN